MEINNVESFNKDMSNSMEEAQKSIREVVEKVPDPERRKFLVGLGFFGAASLLAACGVDPSRVEVSLKDDDYSSRSSIKPTSEFTKQEATQPQLSGIEALYAENGYILAKNPFELNIDTSMTGVANYPTAIAEGVMFGPLYNGGNPGILKYGGETHPTVTYMHYTGKDNPVAGEVIPLAYKLPKEAVEKGVEIKPFALSLQDNMSKEIGFRSDTDYFILPIVTSGNNSGIQPIISEGQIVNSTYKPFDMEYDSMTGSTSGFLSWALLSQKNNQNEIVMEGVVDNSRSKIFVDYQNIPGKIQKVLE